MLSKYYSLDECPDRDALLVHLETLQDAGKLTFDVIDVDVLELQDTAGMSLKETKDLYKYFSEMDIIEYPDYSPDGYYDEDDDDFEDEDDDIDDYAEDDF